MGFEVHPAPASACGGAEDGGGRGEGGEAEVGRVVLGVAHEPRGGADAGEGHLPDHLALKGGDHQIGGGLAQVEQREVIAHHGHLLQHCILFGRDDLPPPCALCPTGVDAVQPVAGCIEVGEQVELSGVGLDLEVGPEAHRQGSEPVARCCRTRAPGPEILEVQIGAGPSVMDVEEQEPAVSRQAGADEPGWIAGLGLDQRIAGRAGAQPMEVDRGVAWQLGGRDGGVGGQSGVVEAIPLGRPGCVRIARAGDGVDLRDLGAGHVHHVQRGGVGGVLAQPVGHGATVPADGDAPERDAPVLAQRVGVDQHVRLATFSLAPVPDDLLPVGVLAGEESARPPPNRGADRLDVAQLLQPLS